MGIWVRSQDAQHLVNVNAFKLWEEYSDGSYEILGASKLDYVSLGIYHTEEEALKVLDIIENEIKENLSRVFQMPHYGFNE